MIKITEEKLILLNELLRVSKWRKEQTFFKLSQSYSDDCELSILELLETERGREVVRGLIRNLTANVWIDLILTSQRLLAHETLWKWSLMCSLNHRRFPKLLKGLSLNRKSHRPSLWEHPHGHWSLLASRYRLPKASITSKTACLPFTPKSFS